MTNAIISNKFLMQMQSFTAKQLLLSLNAKVNAFSIQDHGE